MTDEYSFPTDNFLLIGKVGKPHGIHGEVRVFPYSEQPENFLSYDRLTLVSKSGTLSAALQIVRCRVHGRTAIVGFSSVSQREQAEELKGMGILVAKEDIPQLSRDEYYWHQVKGLAVKTDEGRSLGRIEEIFSNGAQDILVIQGRGQEYLIPMIDSIIVYRSEDEIIVRPPPGLLEINSGTDDQRDG